MTRLGRFVAIRLTQIMLATSSSEIDANKHLVYLFSVLALVSGVFGDSSFAWSSCCAIGCSS